MSTVGDEPGAGASGFHQVTLRPGQMWSRRMKRGQGLELTDTAGGACVSALFYNADDPLERYNMPDTLKGQFTAHLTQGHALHSDMGHILCSIIADTCGWHDPFAGGYDASDMQRYPAASYQEKRNDRVRNTRDNFLTELGKYGLGKRDLHANVNFFSKVVVEEDGKLSLVPGHSRAGSSVALRMDMNVLVVLSNTPHPLDPSPEFAPPPVALRLFEAAPRAADDAVFHRRPENARAFAMTDLYFE